jgi:predicted nucleic acid-binding protein
MKILFDTNIILDLMLDRKPFSETAAKLISTVETGEVIGALGATTITTIHYLAVKTVGKEKALQEIQKLLSIFEIAPVNRLVLEKAIKTGLSDFEDAVLYEAGKQIRAEAIVTRNPDDFKVSDLSVYLPDELLKIIVFLNKASGKE